MAKRSEVIVDYGQPAVVYTKFSELIVGDFFMYEEGSCLWVKTTDSDSGRNSLAVVGKSLYHTYPEQRVRIYNVNIKATPAT
jgi:hypothetical protein